MIEPQKIYYPLYKDKDKFIILITGGRGSGKSFNASAFIERLTFEKSLDRSFAHTILYSRYTMVSAHMSIIPEMMEKIDMDGTGKYFRATKTDIINRRSGGCIMFRGIKTSSGNQTAKLKSIHGITTFVCDEAEEWTNEQDFDKIMLSLSGYQRDLALYGSVAAYGKYEMPARIIGYELLRRAVNLKLNIMFEHSGTNQAHLELFQNIRKKGYRTAVDFIVCNTGLAIARAEERTKKTSRYIPEEVIRKRASGLQSYIAAYQKLTPAVKLLDGANNFSPLKKI